MGKVRQGEVNELAQGQKRQGKGVGFKLFAAAREPTLAPNKAAHAGLRGDFFFFFAIVSAKKQSLIWCPELTLRSHTYFLGLNLTLFRRSLTSDKLLNLSRPQVLNV